MKHSEFHLGLNPLNWAELTRLHKHPHHLKLGADAESSVRACRDYLDKKLASGAQLFYGINTGFGALCDVQIPADQAEKLQLNLIRSHSAGMGEEVPEEIVRLMLFLKIISLIKGHSGASIDLVQRLTDLYNHQAHPVIYQLGSLGASGDLAPLAHLSLPLVGEGELYFDGNKQDSRAVLKALGLKPVTLRTKEGLALLNGTQFSTAYGVWAIIHTRHLLQLSDLCASMSMAAFNCRLGPIDRKIHTIRGQKGQKRSAKNLRACLMECGLNEWDKTNVQDPYAFRCVPQVHGASRDAAEHVADILIHEVNAVTDNPNIFPESDEIISGGNFHAQPVALSLDYLGMALSELGSISERRLYQLLSGNRGLPPFLTKSPGYHSGMMIAQYTAASIASQNKQLCTPASVDSIISSNGQEDHVSMAANAATKTWRIVRNVERILAIEFMIAAQAIDMRKEKVQGILWDYHQQYRTIVPPLEGDRVLAQDMVRTNVFLQDLEIEFRN